jgi:biopolymer transport protein ExbD
VTTTFKRDEHAFVIDLVSSSGDQVTITSDKTTIYIDTKGDLYLLETRPTSVSSDPARGELVSFEELKGRLEALRQSRPDESVAIRGAKTANYQRVVDVVNVLESVGFSDVSFAYEQSAD